jgi:hypothetical protein
MKAYLRDRQIASPSMSGMQRRAALELGGIGREQGEDEERRGEERTMG